MTDQPLSSIERPTPQKPQPLSIHALTPQAGNQGEDRRILVRSRSLSKAPVSDDDSVSHSGLTTTIPDPSTFTNGKGPTIDQWLFKMRGKFEVDRDHPSESSKLIYAEKKVRDEALQHLEADLQCNSLTSFSMVEDLFAHLQYVFGDPHRNRKLQGPQNGKQHVQQLLSGLHPPSSLHGSHFRDVDPRVLAKDQP